MNEKQVDAMIEMIMNNKRFNEHIVSVFNQNKQPIDLPFERYAKGSTSSGNVQFSFVIKQVTENICELIEINLKQILSKQFTDVGTRLLQMRQEINQYSQEQHKKLEEFKLTVKQQLQTLKRKIVINNFTQPQFIRTKFQPTKRSSLQDNIAVNQEIKDLKESIKKIKETPHLEKITTKMIFLQEKMVSQMTELKISIQTIKQRQGVLLNEINSQQLSSKDEKNSKRGIQSLKKVLMQEVQKQKQRAQKMEDLLQANNKGFQQYINKQLTSVWNLISNLKRRTQQIEQAINLQNQSFILE